jgi:phosphatidylglycerophosphate synthase
VTALIHDKNMSHLTLEEIKVLGQTPKKKIAHRLGFVYRRVSPYLSYIIINYTRIGANFFSVLAIFTPIVASALFLKYSPMFILAGALLHQLGYFFDVMDGEIARLRKKDTIQGAFTDAVNHFFNIPLLFVGLCLGAYFSTGKTAMIIAALSLSFFSRGNGKYCLFYALGRRRELQLRGLGSKDTTLPVSNAAIKRKTDDNLQTLLPYIKAPWVYPNITLVVLFASILNIAAPQLKLFGQTTTTIELLIYFYAVTYPVLDIGECIRILICKKTEEMNKHLFP